MLRPLLAVDVDGVVNALPDNPDAPLPAGQKLAWRLGFPIRYNPGHGAKLVATAREAGADLVWCTTWQGDANTHIAPLVGLPPLPWVPLAPNSLALSPGEWKAAGLAAYATVPGGFRPFAWLDDDACQADLGSHPGPGLVVEVDPRTGLQDGHLAKAVAWLESLRADTCA